MGDQIAWINKDEAKITAAFESALKSRQALRLHSGISVNLYQFENRGSDWCKGEICPFTKSLDSIDEAKGNRVSIWLRDAAEERQMRELVRDLFPLDDKVLLKPTFAGYNSRLQKTVVCCMPITDEFTNWISKQTPVCDGYLHHEAKNMIRSILSFDETLWKNDYVCDGLNDPQKYAMMDAHVRVLPFTVRRKQESDSEICHRLQFADLLENHLNTIWKDVDVEEFIKCLRDPRLSLDDLLNHPLLLPPERRMALYLSLWREKPSPEQNREYTAITSYSNWVNSVPPDDEILGSILTYDMINPQNTIPMYDSTTWHAHKFARDTCSHYLKMWRSTVPGYIRAKSTYDIVDKPLKQLLPGLLSKIYAFSRQLGCGWVR